MTRSIREIHNKYLRDPKFAAIYLNEALDEGNPAVIRMALRNIADAQGECKGPLLAGTQPICKTIENLLSDTSDSRVAIFPKAAQELGFKVRVEA